MNVYEHEIEIEAPIDYVFEWGTTPENWLRATPSVTEVVELEANEDGRHFRNTMKILGRTIKSEERYVVDEQEYHTVSYFDDDEMRGEMHYYFTETDTGTHVRLFGEFESGTSLFERALSPVINKYLNRQFRNSLKTMKELIEVESRATVDAAA